MAVSRYSACTLPSKGVSPVPGVKMQAVPVSGASPSRGWSYAFTTLPPSPLALGVMTTVCCRSMDGSSSKKLKGFSISDAYAPAVAVTGMSSASVTMPVGCQCGSQSRSVSHTNTYGCGCGDDASSCPFSISARLDRKRREQLHHDALALYTQSSEAPKHIIMYSVLAASGTSAHNKYLQWECDACQ